MNLKIAVLFQGKSTTADPSGVAQGIPAGIDDDSIASLEEDDEEEVQEHLPPAMPTPTPTFHSSTPMDHDEELFKGNNRHFSIELQPTRGFITVLFCPERRMVF